MTPSSCTYSELYRHPESRQMEMTDIRDLGENDWLSDVVIRQVLHHLGLYDQRDNGILLDPSFLSQLDTYLECNELQNIDPFIPHKISTSKADAEALVTTAPIEGHFPNLPVLMPFCVGSEDVGGKAKQRGEFPVGGHWVLVVIYRQTCQYTIFNSMSSYLVDQSKASKLVNFCARFWLKHEPDIRRLKLDFQPSSCQPQRDGTNCGVFMIENVRNLLQSPPSFDLTEFVCNPKELRQQWFLMMFGMPYNGNDWPATPVPKTNKKQTTPTLTRTLTSTESPMPTPVSHIPDGELATAETMEALAGVENESSGLPSSITIWISSDALGYLPIGSYRPIGDFQPGIQLIEILTDSLSLLPYGSWDTATNFASVCSPAVPHPSSQHQTQVYQAPAPPVYPWNRCNDYEFSNHNISYGSNYGGWLASVEQPCMPSPWVRAQYGEVSHPDFFD